MRKMIYRCSGWKCNKNKKDGNDYVLKSKGKEDLKELTINYFDLERDYKKIKIRYQK